MLKTVSASNLRIHVRRVLDEGHYSETECIVEKFGQPAAAIISLADFELFQAARQQAAAASKEPDCSGALRRDCR